LTAQLAEEEHVPGASPSRAGQEMRVPIARSALRILVVSIAVIASTALPAPPSSAAAAGVTLWNDFTAYSYMLAMGTSPDGTRVFTTGVHNYPGDKTNLSVAFDATTGDELWSSIYHGGTETYPSALVVSADGATVFVTGFYITDVQGDDFDWFTIALDASTGAQLWLRTYDGPPDGLSRDEALNAVVSPDGSTLIVGGSVETHPYPHPGVIQLIAYDATTGATRWVNDRRTSFPTGLAIDPAGRTVFIVGNDLSQQPARALTIAYDARSGARRWSEILDGAGRSSSTGEGVAVTPDGERVLVGATVYTETHGSFLGMTAYEAADGATLWSRTHDRPPGRTGATITAVAMNPRGGQLFATGATSGRKTGNDYVTVAYDVATGKKLWIRTFDSRAGYDVALAVAVDPSRHRLYVTGQAQGVGESDYFTVAYGTADGRQTWSRRDIYGQTAYAIVALEGEVVVTGAGGHNHSGLTSRTIAYQT
jgi:PQQ-like domain